MGLSAAVDVELGSDLVRSGPSSSKETRSGSQRPNGYRAATRWTEARNGYQEILYKLLIYMELADGFEPTTC